MIRRKRERRTARERISLQLAFMLSAILLAAQTSVLRLANRGTPTVSASAHPARIVTATSKERAVRRKHLPADGD